MDWTFVIIVVSAGAALLLIKRLSFVSAALARQHLARGALIIDVRTAEEYRRDRVPGAINIPLGELRERLPQQVKEPDRVILVHCLSGGRSAIARRQLKALGYQQTFNLGSLGRAQQIVREGQR